MVKAYGPVPEVPIGKSGPVNTANKFLHKFYLIYLLLLVNLLLVVRTKHKISLCISTQSQFLQLF